MRIEFGAFLAGTFLATPVFAADQVLYSDIPAWVDQADLAAVDASGGPPERLVDWQYRIEDSVVYAYVDRAVRIDNPQALMAENQLSLVWSPDKGDLTINRLEIRRGSQVIDLLAQGVAFEVIRREQGLEQRLIDGELTATLSVPGLREGDVLRTAFTISTDDQALGDEVQVVQFLPSAPWQVARSRAIVTWPEGEEMFWRAEDVARVPAPQVVDGFNRIEVSLPLRATPPLPEDAPLRYQRPSVLRVGSFADWPELSRAMAPHFESAAQLSATSPIRQQARTIMASSRDPLTRAALATQLVQDEVSYLLNGLDGGNYLPQPADETWENRYGDCKAKSVLLMALLREMGITAEVVLVSSQGGDMVPELLPLPASFDHMIVHATIDGTDYWLDGTSSATRLSTIGLVPAFYNALPVRSEGADLMPMVQRDPAQPNLRITSQVDHSAGIDFPSITRMEIIVSGAGGAAFRSVADNSTPDVLRELATNLLSGVAEGMQISDLTVDYDTTNAVATLRLEGVRASDFEFTDGRVRMNVNDLSSYGQFNPDRARLAWRNIPVVMGGPSRSMQTAVVTLPDGGVGYTLDGDPQVSGGFGGMSVNAYARLAGQRLEINSEVINRLGEIAPSDLAEAKLAARRLANYKLSLLPLANVQWRWDLTPEQRTRRAAPIRAAYQQAMEFVAIDDTGPLQALALFNASIFDFPAAIASFDELIEREPSAWAYQQRANVHQVVGNELEAIADLNAAYDLEPHNVLAMDLARLMAYEGDVAGAEELLAVLPVGEGDAVGYADVMATVAGLGGDTKAGLDIIAERLAAAPQNADVLNSDCWFRGLFNVALEDALERCTQAVERAQFAASALDSRALVHYRLGDMAAAVRDLDGALALAPGQAESLFLRGTIRLSGGDRAGQRDIDTALRIEPNVPEFYAKHGIAVPS